MKYTETMSKRLNELLAKNIDAETGYKKAAEMVKNSELKNFFESESEKRSEFGTQLKNEIRMFGEFPEESTSLSGDLHRTWMDVRTVFSTNNEEVILKEVVKAENTALDEYREVMKETALPPTTERILSHQLANIKNAVRNAQNFEVVLS